MFYYTLDNNSLLLFVGTLSFLIGVRQRSWRKCSLALVVLLSDRALTFTELPTETEPARSSIIVTGTSSGLGSDLSFRLAELGYHVFATVRRHRDGTQYDAIPNIEPVIVDVTNATHISLLRRRVDESNYTLVGLVNNAGISEEPATPFFDIEQDIVSNILNVNLDAPMRLTHAFFNQLNAHHGRVVMVGSPAGRAVLFPGLVGYHTSKFGLEGLTIARRREVTNISFSITEPGFMLTPIVVKSNPHLQSFIERHETEIRRWTTSASVHTDAVLHALTSEYPLPRYTIGLDAKWGVFNGWLAHDYCVKIVKFCWKWFQ